MSRQRKECPHEAWLLENRPGMWVAMAHSPAERKERRAMLKRMAGMQTKRL